MTTNSTAAARIALVGDRDPKVRSHQRIPQLAAALLERDAVALDLYWVGTDEIDSPEALRGFDGVWLLPGSPYRSEAGALAAARAARESGTPFLGTCAGFQHALLEFAQDVCGLTDAAHAENDPDADAEQLLIAPLACSLVGHELPISLVPGSLAEGVLGAERSVERYHCGYGLHPDFPARLERHGIVFSGHDAAGDPRIAELPRSTHPFFLATLFQPELAGDGTRPHPFVEAFARAATDHVRRHALPTGR
ncbi:CTP synthase C-terminal region-related (seleno)protein [Streptacidiphilus anmyonensis]|uniref:CTP synthase C-terminal region-related (seleno)protein n=1 Tax=Streptacidiphilus anmyonensis TaxID=405782 RepID=UPI0005A8ACA4|nr:CTP synthase [Streptacidiphilus anmyonensis]